MTIIGAKMAEKISRTTIAALAGVKPAQFDYLRELDIVRPDIGDQRKGYSPFEARLAVIAGRAMSYGLTPNAIAGPIAWLRTQISWPLNLSTEIAEAAVELEADRIRPLYDDQPKICTDILAAWLFSISLAGIGAFEISHDVRKERLENAKQSDSDLALNQVRISERRAREMLKQPRKWPNSEEFRAVERAIDFELACKGKRNLFLHVATGADNWKTFLNANVMQMEGESAWLVIDIRRLFADRNFTI
jgi:hypothetical protein